MKGGGAWSVTHRLRVREWPQPVIILLSSSIPKSQIYRLAVNHHVGRIVIKPEIQRHRPWLKQEKREPFL